MAGLTALPDVLAALHPTLAAEPFVFVTLPGAHYGDAAALRPVAAVAEAEGLSLVVPEPHARAAGLPFEGVYRRITLQVHSSLEAVGLTAAVAACLAARGIAANVVAGYHHDHLLVPTARAGEALAALRHLAAEAAAGNPPDPAA